MLRVAEGDLWLVMDLLRDPDTGESRADPALLRDVCAACRTAPRQTVSPSVLGHG